jgi:hypothetical protein
MWLRYHLAGPLFAWYISIAHATSIGLNGLQTRTTTAADFESFGKQIGLPEFTIKTLGERFAQVSNPVEALAFACQTARQSLGEAQVQATPVDQTVVEVNW